MTVESAGLLLFRRPAGRLEVLLVHPGGPFWQNKDDGAWSVPKGEVDPGEDQRTAALREFAEETGFPAPADEAAAGETFPLGQITQNSGKIVHVWALEGDLDAAGIHSNSFGMEWPPGSGLEQEFPEVDRAAWLPLAAARDKILQSQAPLLDRLVEALQQ